MSRVTDFLLGRVTSSPVVAERDAVPAPTQLIGFASDGGLLPWSITPTTSLALSSVWRCLDILSNGVSQLEWHERRGNLDLPPSRLVQRPQSWRTRREWSSLVVSTLALYDVVYLLKVGGFDSEGVPIALWPIDPYLVTPKTTSLLSIEPVNEFHINGFADTIYRDQMVILHRSPQPTVDEYLGGIIRLARAQFAGYIAADNYASRYWQSGGSPTVVLESDSKVLNPEQISDRWREKRGRGPDYAPVLDSGLHAKQFGADPTTASAVEARKEQNADIGRYFGIPTSLLNTPAGDTETYKTTEQEGIHLVTYTLQNYINAIEDAISDQLPGGRRLYIDPSRLFRGTQLAKAQAYQLATGGEAWMEVDEVRELEGLPPREIAPAPRPAPVGVAANGQ